MKIVQDTGMVTVNAIPKHADRLKYRAGRRSIDKPEWHISWNRHCRNDKYSQHRSCEKRRMCFHQPVDPSLTIICRRNLKNTNDEFSFWLSRNFVLFLMGGERHRHGSRPRRAGLRFVIPGGPQGLPYYLYTLHDKWTVWYALSLLLYLQL